MLIRIAIFDSEMRIGSQLEAWLFDILRTRKTKCQIELFQTKEGLYVELHRQHFDIVFLEVGTEEIMGVQISKYIREYLRNYITKIVYVSENNMLATQLCQFMPIDYLIKPLQKEQIMSVIEKYFLIEEQGRQVFSYRKQMIEYTIPYADIMYVESNEHRIYISTQDGKDAFYDTMENVYSELQYKDFLYLHKSYMVNYHFVKNYHYTEVEMQDGRTFTISRLRRKEIYARYMQIKNRNT